MKKLFALMLSVLVAVSFASCTGNNTNNETVAGDNNTTENIAVTQSTTIAQTDSEYEGVEVLKSVYNNDNKEQYYKITLPTDEGYSVVHGYGSIALDGTWVFCGGSFWNETAVCNSIEEIYDAFHYKWEETALQMLHDGSYSDTKFTVESSEMKEINGFSMCRYEGTLTYNKIDYSTAQVSSFARYFVAYGTQLSEGGYLYWVVFDNSDDQSFKKTVVANADNMAKSLQETTIF